MAQTVIGLFENESDARRAAEQLEQSGISRSSVDIGRSGAYTQQQGVSSERESENGITRFFKNLFGDDDDADRYSRVSSSGDYCIVTVHARTQEEAERAADLLDDAGAINVDEQDATYSRQGVASSDRDSLRTTGRSDSDATIERVQEELQVGKREVERGGVRVRSRIVERPVEETLRLREEHVHVERNPVNRPLSDADRTAFQEQNIELTERAEVPVVNKEARVVEEIRISKDVDERTETIRDTVRSTEVDIDEVGDRSNTGSQTGLRSDSGLDDDELNRSNTRRNSL
jgi:stress response protein YsnF